MYQKINMEKKSIIIVVCILLILGIIILIPKEPKNSNQSANNYIINRTIQIDEQTTMTIEENLKYAIEKCRESYNNSGKTDFNIYFSIDSIDNYFENGKVSLANELASLESDSIHLYNSLGKEIETIPKEVEYEKENYTINPDQKYLIKVYSFDDSQTRYYQMKISRVGYADFELMFYTEGEDNSIYFNNDLNID